MKHLKNVQKYKKIFFSATETFWFVCWNLFYDYFLPLSPKLLQTWKNETGLFFILQREKMVSTILLSHDPLPLVLPLKSIELFPWDSWMKEGNRTLMVDWNPFKNLRSVRMQMDQVSEDPSQSKFSAWHLKQQRKTQVALLEVTGLLQPWNWANDVTTPNFLSQITFLIALPNLWLLITKRNP